MVERGPAALVLEDGRIFTGSSYGMVGETFGEAVFATGMTGYQETLTDPSYHRQVVVMTAPHIGNTGWNREDDESARIWVSGFVVRDPALRPSSWRATGSLEDELVRLTWRQQPLTGPDPGALVERVRRSPQMAGSALAAEVSTTSAYVVPAVGERRYVVAALDLGIKAMTPALMAQRGIEVHVLPATATFADIVAVQPDGVFFSNGPGDPATADREVGVLREVLAAGIPFFGICFGNQLLGRALGFGTYKLTYGHRGINQPVLDMATGKVEVTAHNHGFAVDAPRSGDAATDFGTARVSHICLNDDVVEGLELRDAGGAVRAFSVQYHPEAAAGPHDASYLFDRFVDLLASARARSGKHHA